MKTNTKELDIKELSKQIAEIYQFINENNSKVTPKKSRTTSKKTPENITYKNNDIEKAVGSKKVPEEFEEIKADGKVMSGQNFEFDKIKDIKEPAKILELHGFSPEKFRLINAKNTRWQAQRKGGQIVEMASSKITLEPISHEVLGLKEVLEKTTTDRISNAPKSFPYDANMRVGKRADGIAICSIADFHLGKLCIGKNGVNEYDTKIATKTFRSIIGRMYNQLKLTKESNKLAKIVFYWSQDFLHIDTELNTTARGTKQDTDSSLKNLQILGSKLLIEAVTKFRELGVPVYCPYVRSNHDETSGYALALALYHHFYNDKGFEIDIEPNNMYRSYLAWGDWLFGFAHGDAEGKRLPYLMSTEVPKMWGDSKKRIFFLGHFHSKQVESAAGSGVELRFLSSPAGSDAWHKKSGFVGATKSCQMSIFFKKSNKTSIDYTFPIE